MRLHGTPYATPVASGNPPSVARQGGAFVRHIIHFVILPRMLRPYFMVRLCTDENQGEILRRAPPIARAARTGSERAGHGDHRRRVAAVEARLPPVVSPVGHGRGGTQPGLRAAR